MISIIINTCALGPRASEIKGSGGVASPHSWRAYALQNFILPAYCNDPHVAEVVVCGEWREGPGYWYVHVPSKAYDCTDALEQREYGDALAVGDILVFQHDDHLLDPASLKALAESKTLCDVTVPERRTRARLFPGEKLNNGADEQYISGHCAIYDRAVIEACPWEDVPKVFTWDMEHTKQIREAGFQIEWSANLKAWDIEMGATPWL